MEDKTCIKDGCHTEWVARGLCHRHYKRAQKAGLTPLPRVTGVAECAVAEWCRQGEGSWAMRHAPRSTQAGLGRLGYTSCPQVLPAGALGRIRRVGARPVAELRPQEGWLRETARGAGWCVCDLWRAVLHGAPPIGGPRSQNGNYPWTAVRALQSCDWKVSRRSRPPDCRRRLSLNECERASGTRYS